MESIGFRLILLSRCLHVWAARVGWFVGSRLFIPRVHVSGPLDPRTGSVLLLGRDLGDFTGLGKWPEIFHQCRDYSIMGTGALLETGMLIGTACLLKLETATFSNRTYSTGLWGSNGDSGPTCDTGDLEVSIGKVGIDGIP